MSNQKPNDGRQNNKGKKRASVAARMSSSSLWKPPQSPTSATNMPEQTEEWLHYFQDHPLMGSSRNTNPQAPTSSRHANNIRIYPNNNNNNNNNGSHYQKNNTNRQNNKSPARAGAPQTGPNYFGAEIPESVMEDLLFRFLYNIPENEKNVKVRVCFQVEQAHWFFVDFYCSAEHNSTNLCKELGFREFTRQVFYKCDYLAKWKDDVESIIEEFRFYKSNVPTYGVILLDSSLNNVLLVQGYFASKNSWGFPKGKVNEDEIPIQCAIREAYEEVGFDATNNIVPNCRPLQFFLNDTLIRLYIAVDVPFDYPFEPHLRKEIRKISWFSIWDLPKDRDDQCCRKLGFIPNNFYSVIPFVNGIQAFVRNEQAKRQNSAGTKPVAGLQEPVSRPMTAYNEASTSKTATTATTSTQQPASKSAVLSNQPSSSSKPVLIKPVVPTTANQQPVEPKPVVAEEQPVFVSMPCNAWKNFKFDRSKLLLLQ